MRLLFTPLAEQDLETIGDYIALDNPLRAASFIGELREQCQRIVRHPSAYARRPELGKHILACPYGQYMIFFESHTNEILVARILHGARDMPTLFNLYE